MNRADQLDRGTACAWHTADVMAVCTALRTNPDGGLVDAEVAARRVRWGRNVFIPRRAQSPPVRLLLQFHSALLYILIAGRIATAEEVEPPLLRRIAEFSRLLMWAILGGGRGDVHGGARARHGARGHVHGGGRGAVRPCRPHLNSKGVSHASANRL